MARSNKNADKGKTKLNGAIVQKLVQYFLDGTLVYCEEEDEEDSPAFSRGANTLNYFRTLHKLAARGDIAWVKEMVEAKRIYGELSKTPLVVAMKEDANDR